jgi:hypothetical protein
MANGTYEVSNDKNKKNINNSGRKNIRRLGIDGIVFFLKEIIDLGKTNEYLALCRKNGFDHLKGPPGLIELTRRFLDEASGDGGTASPESVSFNTQNRARLASAKMIDHCDC